MRSLLDKLKMELPPKYKTVGLWMQICGMPNVGKSTIINQIRTISDLENKRGKDRVMKPLPKRQQVCAQPKAGYLLEYFSNLCATWWILLE